jgi:hypothetical protein
VDVDPVVGKEVLAVDDERDRDEVAVAQPARGGEHAGRGRGVGERDDVSQRQRRDRVRAPQALVTGRDGHDAAGSELDAAHARAEAQLAARADDLGGHRLPHLARPEARVVELLDEAVNLRAVVEQRRAHDARERQRANPLSGPLGADLRRRHPPDLLGVRAEEQLEQPPAEAVADPLLERLGVPACDAGPRRAVRRRAARQLDRPDLADDVLKAKGIVDEAPAPEDPRQPRAQEQLVAEHLVPQVLHLARLREEAVAAEVEAVAVAHHRARQPSDLGAGLAHDDRAVGAREDVACRQPGRPSPQYGDRSPKARPHVRAL